jgi:hypothetical protein
MRLSLVISTTALLGALAPGGTFVDDDASVHEPNIEAIAAAGITKGCNPPANDRYCPVDGVTRGEMAAFLARGNDMKPSDEDHFTDDTGHTFENVINSLAAAGITKGCNPPENDRFCPNDTISRGEMATFLARAMGLEPIVPPERPNEPVIVEGRDAWGARPAIPELMTTHTVERITIHHAGTQSGTTGPAQFRGWQSWHMDGQGWGDLAYHLLIGIDGTVYQGRDPMYEGDTGTNYDTTGHFLVVVEGNFDQEEPTDAQLDSLTRVLAAASEEFAVSPETISGHRDHAATTCPGTHLHALIASGELQGAVQALIDRGGVDLIWPN